MNAFDQTFLAVLGGFGDPGLFVMQAISIFLYGQPVYILVCVLAPMMQLLEVMSRRDLIRAYRTLPSNNAERATQLRLAEKNLDGTLHLWFIHVGVIALVCLVPILQLAVLWHGIRCSLVNVYRSRFIVNTVKRIRQTQLV